MPPSPVRRRRSTACVRRAAPGHAGVPVLPPVTGRWVHCQAMQTDRTLDRLTAPDDLDPLRATVVERHRPGGAAVDEVPPRGMDRR
jgi:hypothetical protein